MSLSEVTENLPGLQVNIYCVQKSRIKIVTSYYSTIDTFIELKLLFCKNRLIY